MSFRGFLIIFLIFTSLSLWSQSSISLSELSKGKDRKYVLKQTNDLFSGIAFGKYENGQVGMQGKMTDGLFNGLWTWWYKDGSKKRETTYVSGVKEGYSYWWFKNGVKKSEIKYSHNKNIEQKRWDETGNLLPNPKMGRQ